MKTLIIGCGYLGMRVARTWLTRSRDVFALTRSSANAEKLLSLGIRPIIGDVTDPDSLRSLPKVQTVLHAVGFDRTSPKSMRDVYVDGLRNVLEVIASRVERFVYVSSTSVYGQSRGEQVDETSECNPSRENGKICLDAERLVWRHFPQNDSLTCRANVLRLAGIYGPGRLIARIEELKTRKPIGGNPKAWLNLIHADDAAQAILACEDRGRPRETYLVCDDRPISRRDYYEALASQLGIGCPTFVADESLDGITRSLNKRCSNKKLRECLGVRLEFSSCLEGLPHALNDNLDYV